MSKRAKYPAECPAFEVRRDNCTGRAMAGEHFEGSPDEVAGTLISDTLGNWYCERCAIPLTRAAREMLALVRR